MHGGLNLTTARRKSEIQKIHDRLSADLPIKSMVSIAIVEDPYARGEKIKVLRSVRDDPLAGMHSRGQIDDAQLAAGRLWQRYYEQSEVGSIRAIDPAKEAVDGGRIPEPITDEQIVAFQKLSESYQELGAEGCALVKDILGSRLTITVAAARRGCVSDLEIKYIGRRFRECLDTLAILWGFAMRG